MSTCTTDHECGKNMLRKLSYVVYSAHTSWHFLWSACVLTNAIRCWTTYMTTRTFKNQTMSIYGANDL